MSFYISKEKTISQLGLELAANGLNEICAMDAKYISMWKQCQVN
jgi:hypothetical protein